MVRAKPIIGAIIIITAVFSACKTNDHTDAIVLKPLIDINQLSQVIDQTNIKVIDLRPFNRYQIGHIPTAIQLWRTDIEDSTHMTRGIAATLEQLQQLLQSKGLNDGDHIVIYDDKGDVDAARLWWLLRLYNYPSISLLDGGLQEWENRGLPLSTDDEESHYFGNIQLGPMNPQLLANKQRVLSAINNENYRIIDVRTPDEYSGYTQKSGVQRSGRIPESIFFEYSQTLDQNDKFLSQVQLLELVTNNGITKDDSVIVYCQSGVRSSHFTFVLRELLDFDYVANYDGSWIEWSHNLDLPIEIDSINITMN